MNPSLKINNRLSGYLNSCLLLIVVFLFGCRGEKRIAPDEKDNINTSEVLFAGRFKLEHLKGCSKVTIIDPWQGASNVIQEWYLVPEGGENPDEIDAGRIIKVPVRNVICMSTTHLAMISALGEAGSVSGFSGTGFIYQNKIAERVKAGKIHEIGYQDNLNKELILELKPDLAIIYGVSGESSGYTGKLKELGIKVIFNADHLENDPLGKAEWIKLFGALYCRENLSDSIFSSIVREYNALRDYIAERIAYRPEVLLGLPFKDTWYVSPGNSYISKLIHDAGGNYLWQNSGSSSAFPASLETVWLKSLKADFWLNTGSAKSRDEILSVDPRLGDLESFKKGNLFNNNKRMSPGGGNDYWESGCLKPQTVLRDIAAILHPELFPDTELYYYTRLK